MVYFLTSRSVQCDKQLAFFGYASGFVARFDEIPSVIQVSTFADMEGEETFDSSLLGHADEVVEERVADDDVIMIKGTKTSSAVCTCS